MPDSSTWYDGRLVKSPVFLLGSVRSGTTLLSLMLDHHPEVAWINEFWYAVQRVGDDGSFPNPDAYRAWLAQDRIFRSSGLRADPALGFVELVNDFLLQRLEARGKKVVGANVHRDFEKLPFIWPEARYIHVVRDPRDVGCSIIREGWAGNLYHGALRWREAEELWDRLAASLPEERQLEVRSERVVEDPEGELSRIAQFLGVEFHPGMLTYPEDTTYAAPDPRLTYQWKTKLSEHEVRLAEAGAGQLLERRGYAASGLPPLEVTPRALRHLERQNRWAKRRFRWRRHGLPLCCAWAMASRLPFSGLRRRLKRRIDENNLRYLK